MSKSKLLRGVAAACIAASLLSVSASAATIGGGTVNADYLNLRKEATTSSASQGLIPQGSFVVVESSANGWYKVDYNGIGGYVKGDFLNFSESAEGDYTGKAWISGYNVRLRKGASTNTSILGEYSKGTEITVLGVEGKWIKVSISGVEGYVHSDYVSFTEVKAGSSAPAATSLGSQIANFASGFVGCDYVWGGTSPSGFDCSGLMYYSYGQYGYSLHRVAQDQYNYDGVWVSKDNLAPGDLVFFGGSAYSIGHVGMYIGNGKFVHASTYGVGVIISELSGWYNYQGAKRIVN